MIVAKEKILSALVRAQEHATSTDEACAVVAQALCMPVEAVQEVATEAMADDGEQLA